MTPTYTPPVITVAFDFDEDLYILMATSHARTQPAGERLFRGEPWPVIQFSHATLAEAEKDAATLRTYLEECASGKVKDREVKRGWWEE